MIAFVITEEKNTMEADHWSKHINYEGYPSVHWSILPGQEVATTGPVDCPHTAWDLAGFEVFRLETQPAAFQVQRYGRTPDEVLANAPYWYANAVRVIERMVKEHKVDTIITRGSAVLACRAALYAAEDLGLATFCIEDGLFQRPGETMEAQITVVVTPRRAYYEEPPKEWCEPKEHLDEERWKRYHKWWLANRRTKYTGSEPHNDLIENHPIDLPVEFMSAEKRIVWFGQLQGDASLYYRAYIEHGEDLWRDDVWYKPHPFGVRDLEITTRKPNRILPVRANIHQVLPLCDVVAGVTTNVCLESWMYRRNVVNYGDPFYSMFGVGFADLESALHPTQEKLAQQEALRWPYLDWFIHDVQVPMNDGQRFVNRIHGEIAGN